MPGLIGTSPGIASRHKRVRLVAPGPVVPDGDGGYTQADVPLDPPDAWAHVGPASQRALESMGAGTVLAQATHLVTLPYHPGITIQTVVLVEDYPRPDRRLSVLFRGNPDERDATLDLVCAEVVS